MPGGSAALATGSQTSPRDDLRAGVRITEAGIELDAEFTVDLIDGQPTFTMFSQSGSSGGRPRRNPQYRRRAARDPRPPASPTATP